MASVISLPIPVKWQRSSCHPIFCYLGEKQGNKYRVSPCSCIWVGWVYLHFGCSTMLPSCPALSAKFPSAQAELGRLWNNQNQIQPNPGARADGTPCVTVSWPEFRSEFITENRKQGFVACRFTHQPWSGACCRGGGPGRRWAARASSSCAPRGSGRRCACATGTRPPRPWWTMGARMTSASSVIPETITQKFAEDSVESTLKIKLKLQVQHPISTAWRDLSVFRFNRIS